MRIKSEHQTRSQQACGHRHPMTEISSHSSPSHPNRGQRSNAPPRPREARPLVRSSATTIAAHSMRNFDAESTPPCAQTGTKTGSASLLPREKSAEHSRSPNRAHPCRSRTVTTVDWTALICVRWCRFVSTATVTAKQSCVPTLRTLRDPWRVIFGETLQPAPSTSPASWLTDTCSVRPSTVDGLVPSRYESIVRLHAPDPEPDDWWERYGDLFYMVTSIGAAHTSTPDLAWFTIWEGHGFGISSGEMGWRQPPADEKEQRQRDELREQHRDAARERNARVGPAHAAVPRFELPDRTYYLLRGQLSALVGLRYPDDEDWRNPDLFWPDDRSWFAATDVDFWSLYVGDGTTFASELSRGVTTPSEYVNRDQPLPIEN